MTVQKLTVHHETAYRYGNAVELAQHVMYMRPLDDAFQVVHQHETGVVPRPSQRSHGLDAFGNVRTFFSLTVPHDALLVTASSLVEVHSRYDALEARSSPGWETVRERLRYVAGAPYEPAVEFTAASPYVPALAGLREYAEPSFTPARPIAQAALDLMHRVHADYTYQTASTDVETPLAEVMRHRRGVCQDFSHLMIGALRAIGLAARYVSGYLLTAPVAGAPQLVGADASHAWVAVWCPDTPGVPQGQWLELDPTNDLVPAASHVRLAFGRDFGDVTPLRGVIRGGGRHAVQVRVTTRRVEDRPGASAGLQIAKVAQQETGE